jgi:hypothetical protein
MQVDGKSAVQSDASRHANDCRFNLRHDDETIVLRLDDASENSHHIEAALGHAINDVVTTCFRRPIFVDRGVEHVDLEILRKSICEHGADRVDDPFDSGKRTGSWLDVEDLEATSGSIA